MKILIETSGGGGAVLVVAAALLAGGHGGAVSTAVIAVLVAVAGVVVLALAAGLVILACRARREPRPVNYHAGQVPETRQAITDPAPAALEAPRPPAVNNFFGVDPGQVAEILRRQQQAGG